MSSSSVPPWLTIVTVVKDDPSGFAHTAASLVQQDFDGVEWVVVDSSADATDVPQQLAGLSRLETDYLWEPPAGVYPAMNTGLREAHGEYVYFLNAGDRLHGPDVLRVIRTATAHAPEWLYGQVAFHGRDGRIVVPPRFDYESERRHRFSRGRFPPHQGTIIKASALRDIGGFDPSYRIAGDYVAALRLSTGSDPVEIPEVLADFAIGGLSTESWRSSLLEFHRARVDVFGLTGPMKAWDQAVTAGLALRMAVAKGLGRS